MTNYINKTTQKLILQNRTKTKQRQRRKFKLSHCYNLFKQIKALFISHFLNCIPPFRNSVDPNLLMKSADQDSHFFQSDDEPTLTIITPILLILKMSSAFYVCCIYSSALQIRSYHGSKHYDPDQTAPLEQSDLGPYCLQYLQYRLSKNIIR